MKPMPGQAMAPSLAESWTVSRDGLTYEFVLRKGVKFHNGDPVTAEDVKSCAFADGGVGTTGTYEARTGSNGADCARTVPCCGLGLGESSPSSMDSRSVAFARSPGVVIAYR